MKIDLHWRGMLTTQNIDDVALLIHSLLAGKFYTSVIVRGSQSFKPHVITHLRLQPDGLYGHKSVFVQRLASLPLAWFSVHDEYTLWECRTSLVDDIYDSGYRNPYIEFDGNQVTITDREESDHTRYRVMALENYK